MAQSADNQIKQIKLTSEEREVIDKYLNQLEEIYYKKVKASYFGSQFNGEIHTGENMYYEIQRKLLGSEKGREEIKEFEKFLSEKFFDSKPVTLNPNINKKFIYININGEERKLYNLGEGIKQLIIITYKMFVNRKNTTVFF